MGVLMQRQYFYFFARFVCTNAKSTRKFVQRMNTNIIDDEWLTIGIAQRVVPWSRGTFYNVIKREQGLDTRWCYGRRLISKASLLALIEKSPAKAPAAISRRMRQLGRLSAKKRAAARNGAG
jgi:hypothetical protein